MEIKRIDTRPTQKQKEQHLSCSDSTIKRYRDQTHMSSHNDKWIKTKKRNSPNYSKTSCNIEGHKSDEIDD